jgi:hypothetical protein
LSLETVRWVLRDRAGATVTAQHPLRAVVSEQLVDDDNAQPRVLEVELVEPSLFLTTAPGSARRLAAVLQASFSASVRS